MFIQDKVYQKVYTKEILYEISIELLRGQRVVETDRQTDEGADKRHFHIPVIDVNTTYTFKTRTSASCVTVRFCLDKGDAVQTELTILFETLFRRREHTFLQRVRFTVSSLKKLDFMHQKFADGLKTCADAVDVFRAG